MFINRITACMYTQKPESDNIFKKFESLFDGVYSDRTLDWKILKTGSKILQYSEDSPIHWNGTLAFWQTFANYFDCYDVEVKYELEAKEIVVDMYDEDSSICIIINFNV